MGGIFSHRELTTGDTMYYFVDAYAWSQHGAVNTAWSPLYTVFYGSVLHLTANPTFATLLHRVIIALLATMMVLAVFRRMLPPTLAWCLAAWWAVMPVNFDTTYEIHLFALLPVLLAWIIVLHGREAWSRGSGLAIMVIAAFLVRNETLVTAACFGLVCVVWELRIHRTSDRDHIRSGISTVLAYAVPLAVAVAIICWFLSKSAVKGDELRASLSSKHSVNMGQVYAFGYQQRHPEWVGSPWTNFGDLCRRDFGSASPSLLQMIHSNPKAYAAHVVWNYRLLPSGLQMMLFNGTSGSRDPSYEGRWLRRLEVLPLSVSVLAIIALWLYKLWKERSSSCTHLSNARIFAWLTMASAVPVALFLIVPTQRPRSSYLFPVTVFLMCVIGTAAVAIFRKWNTVQRCRLFMPFVMVALPLLIPAKYRERPEGRPAYDEVERLLPYRSMVARPETVFLGARPDLVQHYIGVGLPTTLSYSTLLDLKPGEALPEFLDSKGINLAEFDEFACHALDATSPGAFDRFRRGEEGPAWKLIGSSKDARVSWFLFSRS